MYYPSGVQQFTQVPQTSKLNVETNPRTGDVKIAVDNPDVATGFLVGFLMGALTVATVAVISSKQAA